MRKGKGAGKRTVKGGVDQTTCDHDYEEFIDPESGGYIKCRICRKVVDCEDPDGDEGNL